LKLDRKIRAAFEEAIDNFIKEPDSEENISVILQAQGIEPNLETVLSFIAGTAWGLVQGYYVTRHGRMMKTEENEEFIQLMKRRAWELRQAFLSLRMKE